MNHVVALPAADLRHALKVPLKFQNLYQYPYSIRLDFHYLTPHKFLFFTLKRDKPIFISLKKYNRKFTNKKFKPKTLLNEIKINP